MTYGAQIGSNESLQAPPPLSVVMSVWNARATVGRAIESILAQSFKEFEFLIVDDGADDGSGEALDAFACRDKRIRILRQENSGLTRALIRACSEARGTWIVRQDADDWSETGRLEQCLALAEKHPECTMISSWTAYRGPAGEFLDVVRRPGNPDEATDELLHRQMGPPAHGSVMFRRDAYEQAGGYRPEFYFGQDSDLWLRMVLRGKIAYVQEVLYHYTLSPGAISGRFSEVQRSFGELGQLCHAARLRGESEKPFLDELAALSSTARLNTSGGSRAAQAGANYRIGVQLARRGDPAASHYFLEALRLQPLHWRAFVRWMRSKART
jgi:glycosyltransferase involved in cell wall biosynthesis